MNFRVSRTQQTQQNEKESIQTFFLTGLEKLNSKFDIMPDTFFFVIRRNEDYVLNRFTFTPEEQYQHVYLSPPVNTLAAIDVAQHRYTYSYSLGGLFGMSTYPIAPRVTPIPIGLPDNQMTRYDKKDHLRLIGERSYTHQEMSFNSG